ncbi:hypothetical protein GPX89_24435 [Nocardia sp. ET3-3]|uniref:Uncharacterized protein n=1 Tax=Nocardia terrae TaxID=2675851 RepID=A0A7K1V1D2_9NOCA|nr:hypothetical protein [Nocardia terrae]MVU80384.1 hypothetical protein [Nocardia terrae]
MAFDILAFTLAALNLTAVVIMLTIGMTDIPSWPISARCRQCTRWTFDTRRGPAPTCFRCRLRPPPTQKTA